MAQCITYILVLVDLLLSSEIIEALPSTVKTLNDHKNAKK